MHGAESATSALPWMGLAATDAAIAIVAYPVIEKRRRAPPLNCMGNRRRVLATTRSRDAGFRLCHSFCYQKNLEIKVFEERELGDES